MSSFVHQMWTCQQLILILPKMNKIKKNYQIEELFKNQNCILEAVNGRLETINEKNQMRAKLMKYRKQSCAKLKWAKKSTIPVGG